MTLLPYQWRWIKDRSPLKIAVKARQVGFSFAATLRAVLECLQRKQTWIFLSKGERQSRLLMEKVQEHVQACGIVARTSESTFFEGTMLKQLEVRFSNGSVIYGLPANPDTARGYSGHVTLDEFAFHQDAAKVYAALYPTVTRGYSLEVISTPNGQQGKFFELAKSAGLTEPARGAEGPEPKKDPGPPSPDPSPRSSWSGHQVSIYRARAQGFAVDVEALRAGCEDEETWLQEYCCEFVSDAANYISMELIAGCESSQATTEWAVAPLDERRAAGDTPALHGGLYLGVDIGRKRDMTVAWLIEQLGDVKWTRTVVTLKGATFETQEKAISDLMEGNPLTPGPSPQGRGGSDAARSALSERQRAAKTGTVGEGVRRCAVDQSGLGMMLAERLQAKFGARVEPVQFTQQVKEKLAPRVKQHFEERLIRIPDRREIRADLNAVKRYVTPAGNIRFDAERTERGHADRFWALALALEAASAKPAVSFVQAGTLVGQPLVAGMREKVL